ncbi:hypothetical protein HQ531_06220 [bacterium]|nr:hypothetical protein [bacterium]
MPIRITFLLILAMVINHCSLFSNDDEVNKDVLIAYDFQNYGAGRWDYDIWLTDFDGEGDFINSLSFSAGVSSTPNLSSTGLQILYSAYSYATSGWEVFAGNVALSSPRQLTKQGLDASNAAFFPDDEFVLYTQRKGNEYNLYHVDSKGKTETLVCHDLFSKPQEFDIFMY